MALGKTHDHSSILWSMPFGLLASLAMGLANGLIGSLGFIIGGLWLSPDLDTKSLALKRWGFFQGIWWPYRKIIPHRSLFSHGPIIGTTIRIFYLLFWITCFSWVMQLFGITYSVNKLEYVLNLDENLKMPIISFISGIEANAWLHLIQDGDPLPIEWNRKHNK